MNFTKVDGNLGRKIITKFKCSTEQLPNTAGHIDRGEIGTSPLQHHHPVK